MDHAVSLASSETQGSAYKIPASSLGESLFLQRHPTSIFGKYLSVRKTIWDLEFSEHLL